MTAVLPNLCIRRASDADAAGVRRCLAAAFAPYEPSYTPAAFADTVPDLEHMARRLQETTVLVAEDETGTLVGTLGYQAVHAGEGHLRGMAVDPRFQGCSDAAALLLRAAEIELMALGCTRVTLDTTQPLRRAIRFYERQGYRATGCVTDFFGMPLFEYGKPLVERAQDDERS